jgi:hypothetical protein
LKVVLIETEGYGGDAIIEVGGERLKVRDAISSVDRPARSGPVAAARFDVVVADARGSQPKLGANPDRLTGLRHQWGWRYTGNGRVIGLDPVRIDLGILVLELPRSSDDEPLLGEFVSVAIDRISLASASR